MRSVRSWIGAGLLAACSGAALAQPVDLLPANMTYGDAVDCVALYLAMDDGRDGPSRWARTFRSLAIEIDEWTNVDGDIGMARNTMIREAAGSADIALADRVRMTHGELLARCGGYAVEYDRLLEDQFMRAKAPQ